MKKGNTQKTTIRNKEKHTQNTESRNVFESLEHLVSTTREGLKRLHGDLEAAMLGILPYIAKLAKRQCRNIQFLEDYFQAGLVGAMKAYKRFNPAQGHRFSTFAHYSIVHEMNDLTRDLILVPMSHHDMERRCTLTRLANKFWEVHNRMPQVEELTELAHLQKVKSVSKLTTEQVRRLIQYQPSPLYLDAPARADDPDITLGDVLAYTYFGLPFTAAA